MNIKAKAKFLIVFLLTVIVFSSLAFAAFADGEPSSTISINSVFLDNVIWPVPGRQIPRKDLVAVDGKTDEQINQTEIYNQEHFVRVPEELKAYYRIKDAYWTYWKSNPNNPDDKTFVKVPDDDLLFRAGYTYRLRVVLESEYNLNVFDDPSGKIHPYYDLKNGAQVEKSVLEYYYVNDKNEIPCLSVLLYDGYDSDSKVPGRDYARIDIKFENDPYSNPFDVLNTVQVKEYKTKNSSELRVSHIGETMIVTAGSPVTAVYGESLVDSGMQTTFKSASSVKVEYEGSPDYYVTPKSLSVKALGAPLMAVASDIKASMDNIAFGETDCGYADYSPVDVILKNASDSTDIKVYPSDITLSAGSPNFVLSVAITSATDLAPGETLKVATVKPAHGLHGNTYTGRVSVVCKCKDNETEEKEVYSDLAFKVNHVYDYKQGGWCTKCDDYNKDFEGRIVSGSGRTYYQNFWPQFTVNLMYEHFEGVYVDGNRLTWDDFSYQKDGYTKFTLQNAYIRTLTPGKHTISFLFKDANGKSHEASGYFRISSATAAYTGDDTDFTRACFMALASLTGIYSLIFYSLKKRFRDNK